MLKSVYYKASTVSVTHHDFYAQRFFSFMTKDVFKNDPSEARLQQSTAPRMLNRRGSKSRQDRPTALFNTPRTGGGGGSKLALGTNAGGGTASAGGGGGAAPQDPAGTLSQEQQKEAAKQAFLLQLGEQLRVAKEDFGLDIAAFVYDPASIEPKVLGTASAVDRARTSLAAGALTGSGAQNETAALHAAIAREMGEKQYFDVEVDGGGGVAGVDGNGNDGGGANGNKGAAAALPKQPVVRRLSAAAPYGL